jgi:DHA1 family bicyclomycin/chloramphenicol resistance-like MFS transporter
VRQLAARQNAAITQRDETRSASERSWLPMSLLTWDKPKPPSSRAVATTETSPRAADALTPLRMTLVGAMLIAVGPISMTLYTPALTLLARVFATSEDAIRTTITVYLFGFALAQLLCGPLSDRYGRRPVVLCCLALYVAGAAIGAAAGSVAMLYLGRVVQGIGACGGMALSRVMVVDRFSGPPAARIISLMSLILSVAPAAAPVLGGTLITIASWRLLFVLMALYGAGLWLLVLRFPETNARPDRLAMPPRALLGNYAMLLTSRAFLGQIVLTAFAVGGFYAAQTLTPFILMGRLGVSSTRFGLLTAALMAAYLVGALATNRLLRWLPPHRLVVLGAGCVMLAALALAVGPRLEAGIAAGIVAVIGPLCLWLFGLAFVMPGVTTAALGLFPRNAGSASALMGSLQMAMGFVGAALCGLCASSTAALALVPPLMGLVGGLAYLLLNRGAAAG